MLRIESVLPESCTGISSYVTSSNPGVLRMLSALTPLITHTSLKPTLVTHWNCPKYALLFGRGNPITTVAVEGVVTKSGNYGK